MSVRLTRLAAALAPLTLRLQAQPVTADALSDADRNIVVQLISLRVNIALKQRQLPVPSVVLLELDRALAELEAAYHGETLDELDSVLRRKFPNEFSEQVSVRRPSWRWRASRIAAALLASVLLLASNAIALAQSVVVPDGRTKTTLTTTGNTTDVKTTTISNGNAFNSFSQFKVGQGDTFNLHVPDQAQRLLNVVHGGPVNIDGVVNGYKDGKIGGDVYFADPYGFVVGKNGSVNVGSLTVRTPTRDAVDKLIDGSGAINDAAAADLIANVTPVSSDGSVVIRGRIRAPGGVYFSGQTVVTDASAQIKAGGAAQAEVFDATVNATGLQQGTAISITAAGDIQIAGTLSADAGAGYGAGQISITAGRDVALDDSAYLSAKGNGAASDGGQVKVFASRDLNLAPGGVMDVSAGQTGNGGVIELSANGTATLAAATLNAGAVGGKAGSVIIDPTDVVITGVSDFEVPRDRASIDSRGGDVIITASDSITVQAGAFINTRQTAAAGVNDTTSVSNGDSGNVSLTAPNITIAGSINTFALNASNSTYKDGNITLTATRSEQVDMGPAPATTAITISGTLHGGAIDVEANATSSSDMSKLEQYGYDAISSLFGAGVGVVDGNAQSTITVKTGANITGSGDVTLNAWSNATADDTVFALSPASLLGMIGVVPSVMVGNVTAKATSKVETSAAINSSGALTVRAHNTANLNLRLLTATTSTPIDVSVAYSSADVESLASVAEGATITANSVHVTARNDNTFSTSATLMALETGVAGVIVAIADGHKSTADAHFDPSLTLTGPLAGQNLTIEAVSNTTKDSVQASSTVGSNMVVRIGTNLVEKGLDKVKEKLGIALSKGGSSTDLIKFGAAIALTLDEEQSAKATLGYDVANAPTINANSVSVIAKTIDSGVRSDANSAVNSPAVKGANPSNPTASYAVSAGVAIADRSLTAQALIGTGTTVTAPNIGVLSRVELPITLTWASFDGIEEVLGHINGNLGIANNVVTSLTDSTADAGNDGIAGSVNLFTVNANATSFVGKGAKLTANSAPDNNWSTLLDNGNDASHGTSSAVKQDFDTAVAVAAQRSIATINFGGNVSLFLNGIGGTNPNANSFGGTFQKIKYSGNTIAGIGDQASVTSDHNIKVSANADDKAIGVSASAGHGGNYGVSGMVALFNLDTATHASISSGAHISGANVTVAASQQENISSVAGSLMFLNKKSIGGMETTNTVETSVQAQVGNNSAEDATQSATHIPGTGPLNPATNPVGLTASNGVNVTAGENGVVQSLAATFDFGTDSGLGAAVSVNSIEDNVGATLDGAKAKGKNIFVSADANSKIQTLAVGLAGGSKAGAAGSAASATITPTVKAIISGGAVVTADDNVGVLAFNNDVIETIAGAGGFGKTAGVGLSVVVNQIGDEDDPTVGTFASIEGTDTKVDAYGIADSNGNSTFAVKSGVLENAPDLSEISAPTAVTPSLNETTIPVRGVAVVSTSHQAVVANAATLGVATGSGGGADAKGAADAKGGFGAGAALTVITTIISSNSNAYIKDAKIDTDLSTDTNKVGKDFRAPDLAVIASNHIYTGDFVAAVAVSTSANGLAGAGAGSAVTFDGKTKAYIQDATIGETTSSNIPYLGSLTIKAYSTQAAAEIVVGGAGGMKGGAASLAVTLFSADTEAYLTGGNTSAETLTVAADSDNGVNVLVGGLAIGGTSIGGSIAVTVNNGTTRGYVGDLDNVVKGQPAVYHVDPTTLTIKTASVAATTTNDLHSLLIAGAAAYTFGMAASADVTTLSTHTISGIYGTSINYSDPAADNPKPKAGAITVAALETDNVDARAGGGSASAGGAVGISVDVVVLHSDVTGAILDSNIASSDLVSVSAEADRNINALTVTGTIGFNFGVSAAVGVVLSGTDASSDVADELDKNHDGTLSNANALSNGASGDPVNSGSRDAVTASLAGGSVTAGTLNLNSTAKTSTSNQAVGVAASAYAGVGGAVAYTDIGSTVVASLDTATVNVPSVSLVAKSLDGAAGSAASTEADAGGGGVVGIGAGVSIAYDSARVDARLVGSATGDKSGSFSLQASDNTTADSKAVGAAAGGVGVGVMVATASKTSNVHAFTDEAAGLTDYANVTVSAAGGGSLSSSAGGVSLGVIGSGTGVAATASDTATVVAELGKGTQINGNTGSVTLSAIDVPEATADAFGVAVSTGAGLGASVALVTIEPTVKAQVDDNVVVSGAGDLIVNANLSQAFGEKAGDATSYAGTGGFLFALNGSVATTTNTSDVEALVGDQVKLSGGDIGIYAYNISDQNAYASAKVGAGGIALGGVVAESDTQSTTKAKLGDYASSNDVRTGALTVVAYGNDSNTAHSESGAGGLVAGNASIAGTIDRATVTTTVGAHVLLGASQVTLNATHYDNYAEFADSSAGSVLGANGAGATHNTDITVRTEVLHNTGLVASRGIAIEAQNRFARTGSDYAAKAGGGGVLNGAGATSATTITGKSQVELGDYVVLTSGTDPMSDPGRIDILADSVVSAKDTVSLSTGGALQGSGTSNDYAATLDNTVTLGTHDTLLSFGNINIGTYTTSRVFIQSLGSTWGILGAVSGATADLDIVTNQTVTIAGETELLAYGNINVTPGQNPADALETNLIGDAQAETYVRSIVAIPIAWADSDVTNKTTLTLAGGSVVKAGQNANLGSYTGTLTPTADGTAHGYELYFIPVAVSNSSAVPHSDSKISIDGEVTAGAFHDLAIVVADCKNAGIYCNQLTITGGFTEAFELVPGGAYLHNLSPKALIGRYSSGTQAEFLSEGVSSSPVDAVTLGTLYASAGSVTVNGASVTGHGTLTANGGASISVTNASPDYLVLGKIAIPDNPGGHVFVTGGSNNASAQSAGITINQVNPDGAKAVTVTNSYTGAVGTSNLGPAIFATGSLVNLGGKAQITNSFGSFGQFAPIVAQNVVVDVPQGVMLVDLPTGLLETTGASPIAQWAPYMIFPGGNPANGAVSADWAVAYAVNAVYNPGHATADGLSGALNNTFDGKTGASIIVYGTCMPTHNNGNECNSGSNTVYSPLGAVWNLNHFSGFGDARGIAMVPSVEVSKSVTTNITTPTAGGSAITANQISIRASYIDINSDITAGTPTSWSVDLPGNVAAEIAADQLKFQNGTVTDPKFSLNGAKVAGVNDSLIKVTYVAGTTAADGKIVVDSVLAAAQVAASIKLDGGILSTNALGHIHVNTGLGQVTINNQTGTPITLQNISAGTSDRAGGLTGSVEIIDRLKTSGPNHFWYAYTPGQGAATFSSSDPDQKLTLSQLTALESPNIDPVFSYTPESGLRWAWEQTAFLSRTVTANPNPQANPETTHWFFTDPNGTPLGLNASQPWYYSVETADQLSAIVSSNGTVFNSHGQVLTSDPAYAGHLLTGQDTHLPFLKETITGTATITRVDAIGGDCMTSIWHCKETSRSEDFASFVSNPGWWDFDYITKATVTLSTSVKADNPIGVNFSGATRGHVTVTSNAPVTIDGQIANPNGDTVLTASNGNLITTANGGVTSNTFNLATSNGAIGSAAALFTINETANGKLDAAGSAGVFLSANSPLILGTVAASAGDVNLSARGDIALIGTAAGAVITGRNVTLTATQDGNIGTIAKPISLAVGGTLDATADGAITLEQLQGDLSVGTIKSNGIGGVAGAVTVKVDNGALLDASRTTSAQLLSDDQIQSIWRSLKLTAALGANANTGPNSATVAAVTSTVNADYQQYWQLINHGRVQGGTFTLDAGAVALYQPIATAAGTTAQQYAQSLYTRLANDFTQYIGADWHNQADFQTLNAQFAYTPPQLQIDSLNQNAVWTEGELRSALSLTALKPSSITDLGTTKPNMAGGNLDLSASKGIGSLASAISIDIADLKSGNLSPVQQRAVALARTPGDLTFVGIDAQGNTVRFSGTTVPAGVTITAVEIKQTAPLFVKADGTLDARAAQGGVFVQATAGDLRLGFVKAGVGDISVAAPGSILAADPASSFVLSGHDITLLASAGDIGSAVAPLAYQGAEVTSASAGGSVYLKAAGSDLVIDRLFAGGDAKLYAPDGGIRSAIGGTTVIADNLSFEANGDVGSAAQPFTIQLGTGGVLDGSTTGTATIAAIGSLAVQNFTAGEDLSITSTADLTAAQISGGSVTLAAGGTATLSHIIASDTLTAVAIGDLSMSSTTTGGNASIGGNNVTLAQSLTGAGMVTLIAQGALTMADNATVSAAQQLVVTVHGDAVLGNLTSLFAGDQAITVQANRILGNGDGKSNIAAKSGKAILTAQNGIGEAARYLIVDTPSLTPSTTAGGLYLHALGDVVVTDLHAPGDVGFLSDRNLTAGTVTTPGTFTLGAARNLSFTTLSADTGATLSAETIKGTSLTTSGSASIAAGTGTFTAQHVTVGTLTLVSQGDLVLPDIVVRNSVSIAAPNLTANIAQRGGMAPLRASFTGFNGGALSNAALSLDAPDGVVVSTYSANDSTIKTTAAQFAFQSGTVANQMLLITPATTLYLNNLRPTPVRDVTEQFYAPGKHFFLTQDVKHTTTDAFVISFGSGFDVTTVDADGNARQGVSLAQYAPLPLNAATWASEFADEQTAGIPAMIMTPGAVPNLNAQQNWVTSVQGDAVNTESH